MIIFKLEGGLGNQLFQYAFARSLSHDLDQELFLDISRYGFNIPVEHLIYCLHPFSIRAAVGFYPPSTYLENKSFHGKLHIYEKGMPLTFHGLYRKDLMEKEIDNLEFPAYFTGYYSAGFDENNFKVFSEKFFIHNEKIIREDLKYLPEISDEFKELAEEIKKSNAIGIHIRRGEYKDLANFGTCSVTYYQKAIEEIASRVENPTFFVFSEDQEWVKKNIEIPYPHTHVYFERQKHAVSAGYTELLKILSLCDHFIIANSTFSWWGAWLGENPDKIIIAPMPWYQSRELLYTETISNKKPILIENNYKEIFNESDKVLFDIKDYVSGDGIVSNDNIRDMLDDNLKIENGRIIIPKLEKQDNEALMLKISMVTYANDNLTIFHRSKQTKLKYYQFNPIEINNYEKPFNIFYYNDDEFEQYVPLPANVELDSINISLANNRKAKYFLKSLEIRAIPQDDDEIAIPVTDNEDNNYYNRLKFTKLNTAIRDPEVNSILSKFIKARVDLKNFGSESNSVIVEDVNCDIQTDYPNWWKGNDGKGLVVRCTSGDLKLKVKCINNGLLKLYLRSSDIRDDNRQRIPIYLKYTEFAVNGENILEKPIFAHHDNPINYKKEVNDSEIIDISVKWEPV